jgi:glyceraldehyde-3-phosphate dehydrogenase (NAD(P))
MKVLVNGIGNIGTTLLALLIKHQERLKIDTVFALKNRPLPWQEDDLNYLSSIGVRVCSRMKESDYEFLDSIIDEVDYIFDCTNNGGGMLNKQWYVDLPNLKGACAQGSEKKFGISYMTGVNDQAIKNKKFVHVVSCNTHSLSSLLSTFTGENLEQHTESDFVVVRRSEDIGNHQRLVSANVVARHLDEQIGTHHSVDVVDLFATKKILPSLTSSDVTTPSQLMHAVRFNIGLNEKLNREKIDQLIAENQFMATSTKFDSNVIFERGRRIGFQGRIYSHAIIISNNLIISRDSIKGWAFIPQEGNTLLSTINAFLIQTGFEDSESVMKSLKNELLMDRW